MLDWVRKLLNLKQIEDDLAMLKTEVDQLKELLENIAPEEGEDDDT
jgi:hypothetical protein